MTRGIITNNGQGIHISDDEVWMTAWEIADLFYTTVGAINSRIKAILKANILKEYEARQCIRLENGSSADAYNLDMIIASSYQVDTGHSTTFRKWLISMFISRTATSYYTLMRGRTVHCIANKTTFQSSDYLHCLDRNDADNLYLEVHNPIVPTIFTGNKEFYNTLIIRCVT